MKLKDLYTRDRANEGVLLDLLGPDGEPLGISIVLRGVDSDAYRQANDAFNRAMVRLAAAVRAQGADATLLVSTQADKESAQLAACAALVAGWTGVEEEYSPEAAIELLREAPYIRDQVYNAAHERDRFLGSKLQTSSAGPSTQSSSIGQQLSDPKTL
jgi:hypothetical protein